MTARGSQPMTGARSQLHRAILSEILNSGSSAHVVIDELGVAMGTHPGAKRNRNEDRIAIARVSNPGSTAYTVALVCDGVGGTMCGDEAASLTIASIISDICERQSIPHLEELAVSLIKRADDLVRKELQGSGATTLVLLVGSADGKLVCANVGDSRAFRWNIKTGEFEQITSDDTIENELKDIPGNPEALINAHGLRGRLSQAIGESGRTSNELRIQTYSECFSAGAALGTDGMWRVAQDFSSIVANAKSATDAVRRSIALAGWVGGVDNASLIVIEDTSKFCTIDQPLLPSYSEYTGVTLWLAGTKIRIPMDVATSGKATVTEAKVAKSRRKTSPKARGGEKQTGVSQLELDAPERKDARAKIEVITGN